ncbi:RDD family [Legionella beliardensis]|uniref:RDD family n=1 Tax=Legionella beliardensis TaxID=91822 RepID=A0A378I5Q0_9GAMM|nr:RDD family protein [Legionella beliardensis]STX30045.1 RDD family [Legionella beliardensis]
MLFRFALATIYDLFIILALLMLTTALCMIASQQTSIPPGSRWYQILLLLTIFTYYFICLRLSGQTVGLKTWRLQVISTYGPLTIYKLCYWLILIPLAIGYGIIRFKKPQYFLGKWTSIRLIYLN